MAARGESVVGLCECDGAGRQYRVDERDSFVLSVEHLAASEAGEGEVGAQVEQLGVGHRREERRRVRSAEGAQQLEVLGRAERARACECVRPRALDARHDLRRATAGTTRQTCDAGLGVVVQRVDRRQRHGRRRTGHLLQREGMLTRHREGGDAARASEAARSDAACETTTTGSRHQECSCRDHQDVQRLFLGVSVPRCCSVSAAAWCCLRLVSLSLSLACCVVRFFLTAVPSVADQRHQRISVVCRGLLASQFALGASRVSRSRRRRLSCLTSTVHVATVAR